VRAAVRSEAFQRSGAALVGSVSGLDPGPGGRNVFFTRASYDNEVRRILEQFGGMGLRRVGIAVAPTESNRAVAAKAAELVRAASLELVSTQEFPLTGQEPAEAARNLFRLDPHVVIVFADSIGTAAFVKAYRQLGSGAFLVGLSVVNHVTVMELIGPKFATGTLISQVVPDPQKSGLSAVGEHQKLMKKYRDEPPSHITLEGFLAAKALVAALQKARPGASRAEIATAIRSLQRADIGGILVDFSGERRGYEFVDIAFLRRNGTLLR
jgi:ABC-type branched-subunit amino acid transport system substrate-binding protein